MHTAHFGFTRHPFIPHSQSDKPFESAAAKEAAGRIRHLVELRGIGLITGESGCGKTTACRQAAKSLHPGTHRVRYAALTTGSVIDTLNVIARELGLPRQTQRHSAWHAIRDEITRLCNEKKLLPVLIVDEAHHLRNEALEDLRLLTSFGFDTEQRVCLLLAGLTELRLRLDMAAHESLAQRLVMNHHFEALAPEETGEYLNHRISAAGGAAPRYFDDAAVFALHQQAHGIPRQINKLAHYALIAAAADGAAVATAAHIEAASAETRL